MDQSSLQPTQPNQPASLGRHKQGWPRASAGGVSSGGLRIKANTIGSAMMLFTTSSHMAPHRFQVWKLDSKKLATTKAELKHLEEDNIIKRSHFLSGPAHFTR
jgi:hypothetical protein